MSLPSTAWTCGSTPVRCSRCSGPNGAGKTTAVEVCEGFRTADAGEVRVLGTDPAGAPDALRARIGVMPQGGGAYPGVRVAEMLRLVAACSAHPLDPAWLLTRSGSTPARAPRTSGSRVGSSSGSRWRAPWSADPSWSSSTSPPPGWTRRAATSCGSWSRAMRRDGVAVLLTTHLMEEAEALADQVVIIDGGRAVAKGTPAALTAGTDQRELRFRAKPGMDVAGLAAALPPGYRAAEPIAGRYLVQGRIDPAVLSTVTAWCAEQGALADDVQVARRSLEDVFLELTGRELRS